MAYKKIIFADETLIDLTEDTVTPETLMTGATAHNNIGDVITGTATSDATAEATDIALLKTAYVNGKRVVGRVPVITTTQNPTLRANDDGDLYFDLRDAIYRGVSVILPTPSINALFGINEDKIKYGETISNKVGTFTGDATASNTDILSGKTSYVKGERITGTIPVLEEDQTIIFDSKDDAYQVPKRQYIDCDILVKIDPDATEDLVPENIRTGATILGISGELTEAPDPSQLTAGPEDILSGKTAYTSLGLVDGDMPSYPEEGSEVLYLRDATNPVPIQKGYHDGTEQVRLQPSAIEDLIPENIRSGETILGISGTYTDESMNVSAYSPYILDGRVAYVNGTRVVGSFLNRLPIQIDVPFFLTDENGDSILDESENLIETSITYARI